MTLPSNLPYIAVTYTDKRGPGAAGPFETYDQAAAWVLDNGLIAELMQLESPDEYLNYDGGA